MIRAFTSKTRSVTTTDTKKSFGTGTRRHGADTMCGGRRGSTSTTRGDECRSGEHTRQPSIEASERLKFGRTRD
jgi:hypothetical protein